MRLGRGCWKICRIKLRFSRSNEVTWLLFFPTSSVNILFCSFKRSICFSRVSTFISVSLLLMSSLSSACIAPISKLMWLGNSPPPPACVAVHPPPFPLLSCCCSGGCRPPTITLLLASPEETWTRRFSRWFSSRILFSSKVNRSCVASAFAAGWL